MKNHLILSFSLLLLIACSGGSYEYMQHELAALQAMNQADSILTDDSLAQALADYFDRHGTPNEQMEAHYLLGRTHADRGEAPAALAAYHDAIDRADTTAADCNYRQLAKVYGQMGGLLYWQQLPEDAMNSFGMAYRCALKRSDTLLAAIFYEQKGTCYIDLEEFDSAAVVIKTVRNLYLKHGDTLSANTAIGPMVYCAVKNGRPKDARDYISIYGSGSRTASDTIKYRESWGQFLIHQGLYHMSIHSTDSAIVYFRRGLSLVSNSSSRLLAYNGLYNAYANIGLNDSIVKYANLRTETSDSVIILGLAEHIQHMQSLYNYDRISKRALKAEQIAENEKAKATTLCMVLVILAMILLFTGLAAIIPSLRRKITKQGEWVRFVVDKMLYDRLNAEQSNQSAVSNDVKTEMEVFLKESLSKQKEGLEAEAIFESFQDNEIVLKIKEYGGKGKLIPEHYWVKLITAVNIYAPGFIRQLDNLHPDLDIMEKNICLLALIMNMPQKSKAAALGIEYHALAMKRKRLFGEFFGKDGSAKSFDENLRKMAFRG